MLLIPRPCSSGEVARQQPLDVAALTAAEIQTVLDAWDDDALPAINLAV